MRELLYHVQGPRDLPPVILHCADDTRVMAKAFFNIKKTQITSADREELKSFVV